jgi:hypothetical protein
MSLGIGSAMSLAADRASSSHDEPGACGKTNSRLLSLTIASSIAIHLPNKVMESAKPLERKDGLIPQAERRPGVAAETHTCCIGDSHLRSEAGRSLDQPLRHQVDGDLFEFAI